ncbi:CSS-motif domain-containing protein [Edwardsiella piscicida]|nr:CSS-motif domain-containing protein [Edwardsiella piscicida]MDM3864212.1 CSS-motif domain-containing protein [Edwardsiella piscicida]
MIHLGGERWRSYLRPLLSAGAVVIVLLLATVTISWQASRGLAESAKQRLTLAIWQIDEALDNAQTAADAVRRYAGQPCDTALHNMLALQATTVPDVRSVSLAQANAIYCSSLYGAFHAEVGSGPLHPEPLDPDAG